MKLIDNTDGTEVAIGDIITDDYGTEWFVLGYSSQKWVQLIENEKLAEVATKFFVSRFDLSVEV